MGRSGPIHFTSAQTVSKVSVLQNLQDVRCFDAETCKDQRQRVCSRPPPPGRYHLLPDKSCTDLVYGTASGIVASGCFCSGPSAIGFGNRQSLRICHLWLLKPNGKSLGLGTLYRNIDTEVERLSCRHIGVTSVAHSPNLLGSNSWKCKPPTC